MPDPIVKRAISGLIVFGVASVFLSFVLAVVATSTGESAKYDSLLFGGFLAVALWFTLDNWATLRKHRKS